TIAWTSTGIKCSLFRQKISVDCIAIRPGGGESGIPAPNPAAKGSHPGRTGVLMRARMDALKILPMPFQAVSLLFVALSSLVLGVLLASPNIIVLLFGLWALWVTLTWLTNYAVRLIDDIADGVREAAAAEVEQANAVADPRAWVHPLLAVLLL